MPIDACPTPDELVLFAQGASDGAVASHVSSCDDCQVALAALVGVGTAPSRSVIAERYRLDTHIGSGAHGDVYKAHDLRLDRVVAVKLLREQRSGEFHLVVRLLREMKLLAQLTQPNVVRAYDGGLHEARPYLVTEWVEGGDASAWVKSNRSWRVVVELLEQAAHGLHAAHRQGIVHRDFKLSNVLVDASGSARVADFGLASALEQEPTTLGSSLVSTDWTQSDHLVGTPSYVAPELFAGQAATPLSDQFSLCVALYEALEGELPFDSLPPTRSKLRPFTARTPRAVRPVITRGLSEDPTKRWDDLGVLAERLRASRMWGQRWRLRVGAASFVALLGVMSVVGPRIWRENACASEAQALRWATEEQASLRSRLPDLLPARQVQRVADSLQRFAETWDQSFSAGCRADQASNSTAWRGQRECLRRNALFLKTIGQAASLPNTEKKSLAAALHEMPQPQDCAVAPARVPLANEQQALTALGFEFASLSVARSMEDYETLLTQAERIRAMAEQSGFRELEVEALSFVALAKLYSGKDAEAARDLQRVIVEAERLALDGVRLGALTSLGFIQATRFEQLENARASFETAEALAERIHAPPTAIAELNYSRGTGLIRTGDFRDAIKALEKARAALDARGAQQTSSYASVLRSLGRAHVWNHQATEALQHYRQSLELFASLTGDTSPETSMVQNDLGTALAARGQLREARDRIQAVSQSGDLSMNLLISRGHIAALTAELDGANQARPLLIENMRGHAALREGVDPVARSPWALAQLELREGNEAEALRVGESAIASSKKVHEASSSRHIRALCQWAFLLRAVGQPNAAQKALAELNAQLTPAQRSGPDGWCSASIALVLDPRIELYRALSEQTQGGDTLAAVFLRAMAFTAVAPQFSREGARQEAHEVRRALEGMEGHQVETLRATVQRIENGETGLVPLLIPL